MHIDVKMILHLYCPTIIWFAWRLSQEDIKDQCQEKLTFLSNESISVCLFAFCCKLYCALPIHLKEKKSIILKSITCYIGWPLFLKCYLLITCKGIKKKVSCTIEPNFNSKFIRSIEFHVFCNIFMKSVFFKNNFSSFGPISQGCVLVRSCGRVFVMHKLIHAARNRISKCPINMYIFI